MTYFLPWFSVLLAFSLALFFSTKRSLMVLLVSLEMLMFFMLFIALFAICPYISSLTVVGLFLCFAASGAALGLTLLVSVSRLYGNDLVSSLLFEKISSSSIIIKIT